MKMNSLLMLLASVLISACEASTYLLVADSSMLDLDDDFQELGLLNPYPTKSYKDQAIETAFKGIYNGSKVYPPLHDYVHGKTVDYLKKHPSVAVKVVAGEIGNKVNQTYIDTKQKFNNILAYLPWTTKKE